MVRGRAFTLVEDNGYSNAQADEITLKVAKYLNQVQVFFGKRRYELGDDKFGLYLMMQSLVNNGEIKVDLEELYRRDNEADCEETYRELIEVTKPNILFKQFVAKYHPNQSRIAGVQL